MTVKSDSNMPRKPAYQTEVVPSGIGVENFQVPSGVLGHPGQWVDLILVAQTATQTRSDEERTGDTSMRSFKISARLERSHDFDYERGILIQKGLGSSFITGNKGFADLEYELNDRKFLLSKNERGEYSYLEFICEAESFAAARDCFHSWVVYALDHLAYVSAAPLFIAAVRIDDLKNMVMLLQAKAPYPKYEAVCQEATFFSELRQVYAMYREALNSSSEFYKFFCFYKIFEGIFNVVKPAIANTLKKAGIQSPAIKDIVPDSPNFPSQYQKYVGKSVRFFFDDVLAGKFRNALAHFEDSGEIIDTSHHAHAQYYSSVLCVMEMCVRQMIANCETALALVNPKKPI